MKNYYRINQNGLRTFSFLLGLIIISITACKNNPELSDLDLIKSFKPDDKYLKSSLVSLHFVIETSSIEKIDTLFSQLIENYDLPVTASGIPDGIYSGQSPEDAFDFRHIVKIEVKDEKIVSIDYNEVPPEGPGKQEDEAYCKEMSITGTSPAIAYPAMEEQMLEKQDMMDVDAVSGASYSLYRFRYALTLAMIKGLLSADKEG